MKTIKQALLGLTLSVLSISAVAQCPTSVSVSVVSNNNNGDLTVSQQFNVAPSQIFNWYYLSNGSSNYFSSSWGPSGSGTFNNIPSGTYTLCVSDSLFCNASLQFINDCMPVTITNTVVASLCNASYSYYRDSNCVSHFINTSTGQNLTYLWNIDGTSYSIANPTVYLLSGYHTVNLSTFSNGVLCDTIGGINNYLVNSCSTISSGCQASFSSYTDSLCYTTFSNTSSGIGSPLGSYLIIDGTIYNPGIGQPLALSNGNHLVTLYNFSNGSLCDTTTQLVNIACNGGSVTPAGCQANSSFAIFADSLNNGSYFAYNTSSGSGNVSYLWNFGDGSTSTQQYPFHQYATPGNYIVCLTVTATSGTTTCTDTKCDSSSVQRMAASFLMSSINVKAQGTAGIKENTVVNGLKSYPNPISDELTIEVELTSNVTSLNCSIIDALGKVVVKATLNDSKTVINTSDLDKGFYFLSISTIDGKAVKTIKLVK